MNEITKEQFDEIVLDGIAADIFIAERSYALFLAIGNNSSTIEKSMGYSELFKETQSAFKGQFLIAIARLFDKPSDRYNTRCVAGLLEFLSKNLLRLPAIAQRPNLLLTMRDVGFNYEILSSVEKGATSAEIAPAIVAHFDALIQSPETQRLLIKLKELRDKRLAHNELVPQNQNLSGDMDIVTFKELFSLVSIAKHLVGVVGWAFMSTVFIHKRLYHLTNQAERPSHAMVRLINGLKQVND